MFVVPPLPAQLDLYFWALFLFHLSLLIQLERRFHKPYVLVPPLFAQCRATQNEIRTSPADLPAFLTSLFFGLAEALALYMGRLDNVPIPPNLLQMFPQVATLGALILVALRIRGSEIIKRQTFAREFGKEIDNLKRTVVGNNDRAEQTAGD